MKTQRDRVLAALRASGRRGIDRTEFENNPTFDNGPLLLRLAARIGELEDEGYRIGKPSKRNGCQVYTLLSEPSPRVAQTGPSAPLHTGAGTWRRETPERLPDGWDRIYQCARCHGEFADPRSACDGSQVESMQCPPGNWALGCRLVEVQARIARRREADRVAA